MLSFLLRLRLLLVLLRFFLVPFLAFSLALLVFALIGGSLYILAVVKTLKNLSENPYLYGPLLAVEVLVLLSVLYLLVVYINKIRRR